MDRCFLCDTDGKCKRFTFYSGVMKGGTTHRLITCTVTFFERWSDLTMHEIQVCRDCQLRLWRERHFTPLLLSGIGAGVALLLAAVLALLLSGPAQVVLPILLGVAALALGGLTLVRLRRYRERKPKHAEVEPLVIEEAMDLLPCRGHTFMTSEQYIERHQHGIIG
jgi:hypothetical protein